MRAGAAGYLLKDVEPAELVRAIRAAHAGEALLDPRSPRALLDELAATAGAGARRRASPPREREVLALIARGCRTSGSPASSASPRRRSRPTSSHILAKLGVTDRTQAALYAVRDGLGRARADGPRT